VARSTPHSLLLGTCCAALLALPLLTAWNLIVGPTYPGLVIKIGPQLSGMTRDARLDWSWSSLKDGTLQKAMTVRVTDAIPIRPLLIRLNNEIRFELFGELTAPGVVRGHNGQLIEESYLEDYCGRTEDLADTRARSVIPKLLEIQSYYQARGSFFVYLLTPSKAADMPEFFIDRVPCPSTAAARTGFLPRYVDLLRTAGVSIVDTASLIHRLRGKYDVDLFPQGGVHWNELGGANAVLAIVDELNRQAGHMLVPGYQFSYTVSGVGRGVDRELADILNIFFPPLAYKTPKVEFQPQASCATDPARNIDAAMVGSSFSHLPAEILIAQDCLSDLKVYFYLQQSVFGGTPYRRLQTGPKDPDLANLRDAKIMIVEENESSAGAAGYIDLLQALIRQ
jgi:alginate O-acetyltransferase complex protein AlgJ